MFITKAKLEELVDKKIKEAFKDWGFREESFNTGINVYGFPVYVPKKVTPFDRTIQKFNQLLKHLKLEYYKKEIKETNGEEKEYVEEGFRKIKVGKK